MSSIVRTSLLFAAVAMFGVGCAGASDAGDDEEDGAPGEIDEAAATETASQAVTTLLRSECTPSGDTCMEWGQRAPGQAAKFTIASFGGFEKVRICVRKAAPERGSAYCKSFRMGARDPQTSMIDKSVTFKPQHFPNATAGKGTYNVSFADDEYRNDPFLTRSFKYVPPPIN